MIRSVETTRALRVPQLLQFPAGERVLMQENLKHAGSLPILYPNGLHPIFTTAAFINRGDWLASCAFCHRAQIIAVTDPRFGCIGERCQNGGVAGADGHFVKVVLPELEERLAIETALLCRPWPDRRSWNPKESVADLVRENREHDVPTSAEDLQRIAAAHLGHWEGLYGESARVVLDTPWDALPL